MLKIWEEISDETLHNAYENFPKRLRTIIKANGERFELYK